MELQSYVYVFFGVLSTLAAFVATAFVLEDFIPQIKAVADLDNHTAYEDQQTARDK